ncbi:hypothetical protein RT97_21020 [Variovorax paradoxus]|uniref:DUF4259 domain-containing protein n=1 Tax=Variovorax paradoxus TaxID=34073 RepID=A0A0D0MBR2_VARPD|nr:DUF4259 domain-containing protein [Variovorax paradoxus]KIQ28204.1 hypothetical protein RT97_21020 [Variovorax paradoxus]
MGTWSTESFGNDDALDWFGELQEAPSALPFIEETLTSGSTESVIAAGAVLAVLSGKDGADVHPDVIAWCAGKAAPPASLKQAAIDAIQAVIDDPEADGHDTWAELGEDDEDYLAWLANLKSIQARLR